MLYLLRYEDDLRDPESILSDLKEASVDADELSLAKQLINGKTSKLDLSTYKNDYEAAVKKLVDAKRKGKPLPEPASEPEENIAAEQGRLMPLLFALSRKSPSISAPSELQAKVPIA
jgi:DNA end-binding protein Ku